MRWSVLVVLALLMLAIYGCEQEAAESPSVQAPPVAEEKETIPTIRLAIVPTSVDEGSSISITWQIASESSLTATHTAVYYDNESHPGVFSTDIGPAASGYTGLTKDFAAVESQVPGEFTAALDVPEGAENVYLRAHAIISGKNYWTDESVVNAKKMAEQPVQPEQPQTKEFAISADEIRFDPAEITVKNGDNVRITFNFNDANIYKGGLDIRSDYFNVEYRKSDTVKSKTVEFTASESFTYTGYWPASGIRKASGQVVVE
ncbi:MAG TPA: hypothetical protein VJC00_02455 [Candidatus Nanoarchaeia archaeon]|nr:hypothetical protein [Candidatus Nanoarchaeia archaeon]